MDNFGPNLIINKEIPVILSILLNLTSIFRYLSISNSLECLGLLIETKLYTTLTTVKHSKLHSLQNSLVENKIVNHYIVHILRSEYMQITSFLSYMACLINILNKFICISTSVATKYSKKYLVRVLLNVFKNVFSTSTLRGVFQKYLVRVLNTL